MIKKGDKKTSIVSLRPHQLTTLHHVAELLTNMVRTYKPIVYDLGSLIYATHETFRDTWTLNIRQYYIDNMGDQRPGRNGVNIPHDVWLEGIGPKIQEMCMYLFYF